jgi:hypothetical protein
MPEIPDYPFSPRSNRYLRPGQFWAIPLPNGQFGAGRVTASPAFGPSDRTTFCLALMDWVGTSPPTAEDLSGTRAVQQAITRWEAIASTGGQILGNRPLELDGIVPIDPLDPRVGAKNLLWGWKTITAKAQAVAAGQEL